MRLLVLLAFVASPALATPADYRLDPDRSEVTFTYAYGSDDVTGQIPVVSADMRLDLDAIGGSAVRVTLDATGARGGFVFATQALRGPTMFDVEEFPSIVYESAGFTRTGAGVEVDGQLTIRGVTRPMRMTAELYRQAGTEPGDRDHMAIVLTGAIDRHEFGVSGWQREVGPEVTFRILAYLDRIP
ncbi:hypothetical protein HKCCE3408_15640 [Rhodobacterales bacterium HKCCE3408]|nr:hypothetical protein [Rhodobacterales bacterium HKCCE3408]